MPKLKFKKAFTLIELLVVITIIATLASAILYSTDNTRAKGRDTQRKDNLKTINSALISYHVDNKSYPPETGTQRDFASDSTDSAGWIPNISTYLEKLPKDPQQASQGRVAGQKTIQIQINADGGDDFQAWHTGGTGYDATAPKIIVGKASSGRVYKAGLRFPDIPLNPNANIINARLIFQPKNETAEDITYNDSTSVYIKILTDLNNPNSPQFSDYSNYINRLITAESQSQILLWNNVPDWNPATTDPDQISFNVTDLVQDEVDHISWQNGYPINFFVHPELNGANAIQPGHGRVFHSFESAGDAPILEITYETADPDPDPDPTPDRGTCDNKQGILCLRVSDNKNTYVLWTQLENANDRDHFNRNEAVCNINDPDWTNTTSPYYGLGRPAGGFLSYCIKSPQ